MNGIFIVNGTIWRTVTFMFPLRERGKRGRTHQWALTVERPRHESASAYLPEGKDLARDGIGCWARTTLLEKSWTVVNRELGSVAAAQK